MIPDAILVTCYYTLLIFKLYLYTIYIIKRISRYLWIHLGSVYDGFTLCVEHFTVPRTLREAIFMHGVLYQAAAAKWWHVINGGTHDQPMMYPEMDGL